MDAAGASATIAPSDRADAHRSTDDGHLAPDAEYRINVFGLRVARFLMAVPIGAAIVVGLGLVRYLPVDAMFGSGMAAVVVGFGVFLAFASRVPTAFALVLLRGLVSEKELAGYVAFEHEVEGALNAARGFLVGATLALLGPAYLLIRAGGLASVLGPEERGQLDLPFPVLIAAALAIAVAAFAAGLAIWRMWVVGRKVHLLGKRFELRIQMGHPDGCGGFEPLGNLSLWNALILAVPGVFLGWWIAVAPSNPYYERWVPLFSGLAGIVVVLAIVTFLVPLWNVHVAMARSAEQLREEIEKRGRQIDELARELVVAEGHLTPEERERKAKDLELQQALFRANERIPTWPIDVRILLKFGSSQLVPLLGLTGLGKPLVDAATRLGEFLAGLGTT